MSIVLIEQLEYDILRRVIAEMGISFSHGILLAHYINRKKRTSNISLFVIFIYLGAIRFFYLKRKKVLTA